MLSGNSVRRINKEIHKPTIQVSARGAGSRDAQLAGEALRVSKERSSSGSRTRNKKIHEEQEWLLKKGSLQDQWQLKSDLVTQQDLLIMLNVILLQKRESRYVCIQWLHLMTSKQCSCTWGTSYCMLPCCVESFSSFL